MYEVTLSFYDKGTSIPNSKIFSFDNLMDALKFATEAHESYLNAELMEVSIQLPTK